MQSITRVTAPRFLPLLRPALRHHSLLIAMVLPYAVFSFIMNRSLAPIVDSELASRLVFNMLGMVPSMFYFLFLWRIIHMRYVVKPEDEMAWLRADLASVVNNPRRIVFGLVGLVFATLTMISFAQMKRLIPILQPFAWDETFAELDLMLHLGADPGVMMHSIFGHPWIVTVITGAYNYWMFLMYFSLLFACFTLANPEARLRYLISFVLCWGVGGNLIATLFSSVGPVFFERQGLGDGYAPLMQLLANHAAVQPLTVLEAQDALWWYSTGPMSMNGISAFPSMHVGSTTLMTLYAWSYGRRAGQAMTVFFLVILSGSVMLAWHYAVDGYAGILIGLGSWWLAGRLMAWAPWHKSTAAV